MNHAIQWNINMKYVNGCQCMVDFLVYHIIERTWKNKQPIAQQAQPSP